MWKGLQRLVDEMSPPSQGAGHCLTTMSEVVNMLQGRRDLESWCAPHQGRTRDHNGFIQDDAAGPSPTLEIGHCTTWHGNP